jgi:transposase
VIDGQIRGILKTFGLVAGNGNNAAFARRARMLAQDHPVLSALIDKLTEVRRVAIAKVAALDREIRRFVRADPTLQRFMTMPGVGPITALAFRSTIDEPDRFKRATQRRSVSRIDTTSISVRRNGPAREDIEVWRSLHADLPL